MSRKRITDKHRRRTTNQGGTRKKRTQTKRTQKHRYSVYKPSSWKMEPTTMYKREDMEPNMKRDHFIEYYR
jgi:hypothetical protein